MSERFRVLVRHFFGRFFDKESISADGDEHANIVQIVAMLALPGAIVSLFTIVDHPLVRSEITRLWLRSGDRYVFVCYSMVVMGFVMTFKWDSLFPERRDYLILTPLPISLREFFAAKVVSLCGFLLLFVVAINFFSCIIIPYVYLVRDNRLNVVLPGFVAHAAAVLGGSIFMAMLFAAFQGVLINIMTPAAFRRISSWIQMLAMMVLVTVLLITPALSPNIRVLVQSNSPVLDYIPVFWFLGVYEVLNPEGTLVLQADAWAKTALEAIFVVGVVFVLTYLISYRRYSKKVLEGIESDVFKQSWPLRTSAWLLNHSVVRHPLQRASFYFIGRIFSRSAKHRLFIAMYSGIGLAVTLSSLFVLRRDVEVAQAVSSRGLIDAPLILSFFVVSGLRATFNIPYELTANWMFQLTTGGNTAEMLRATRRWVFLRGIVPVHAVLAPLEFAFFDPADAIFLLAFSLAIAALLTELFFFKFNKVPFTCSYLPPKSQMAFLAGAYLYGFTIYTFTIASLEQWVAESPARMIVFFTVVAGVLAGVRYVEEDQTREIIYEDEGDPVVRQLNLT